ncbi:MAG TPA: branched-chain amino acid ABC transporter permease [Clostridiales bacterium]|nr:branched-chain amino acid ABC transporter permease [Clostridiales bacterium]
MKKLFTLLLTFAIIQILIYLNIINDYLQATLATICINIILAVSLNLITGFTGQFSLGHAGFMSIGAYACAIALMRVPTVWGFLAGLFSGAILAALVGFLVGLPTLRLRGDYLAIATLGMSEIIRIVFLNMDSITNGAAGLSGIPRFTNWFFLYVFMVGSILLIAQFLNSSHGRACISIREDEIAAEAVGINTTKYKVTAFTIGAFCAGIAGALYASYFYFLKPDTFGFQKSIDILVIVVLGGLGSISGSVLAAVLLALISTLLQDFSELQMIIYPMLLIIIMIFRPQGLMGSKELSLKVFQKLGKILPARKGGR